MLDEIDTELAATKDHREYKHIPLYKASILYKDGQDIPSANAAFTEFMMRNQGDNKKIMDSALRISRDMEINERLLFFNYYSFGSTNELNIKNQDEILTESLSMLDVIPYGIIEKNTDFLELMRAKGKMQNATQYIEIIPEMMDSYYVKNFRHLYDLNRIQKYITSVGKVYGPITFAVYYRTAVELKNRSKGHLYIPTLIKEGLRNLPLAELPSVIPKVIDIFPIQKKYNNNLIAYICTIYGKEICFQIIDKVKEKKFGQFRITSRIGRVKTKNYE